jgi:hypothetical protein
MSEPITLERLQHMLDRSPFIHHLGLRAVAIEPAAGKVVVSMTMKPEFERGAGSNQFHGGVLSGLIDTAGDDDKSAGRLPAPGLRPGPRGDRLGAPLRAQRGRGRYRRP